MDEIVYVEFFFTLMHRTGINVRGVFLYSHALNAGLPKHLHPIVMIHFNIDLYQ
jgi:hypothetical protein